MGLWAQAGDARQRPIDMVSEYKCVALNVDMEATVGERTTVDALVAASNVNDGAREEDVWAAAAAAAAEHLRSPTARSGSPEAEGEDDAASEARSERGDAAGFGDGVMAYFGDHQARVHACLFILKSTPFAGAHERTVKFSTSCTSCVNYGVTGLKVGFK